MTPTRSLLSPPRVTVLAGIAALALALARCNFPPDDSSYACDVPDTLPADGGACPSGYVPATSPAGLCVFADPDCATSVGARTSAACNGFPAGSWPVCPADGGTDAPTD